MKKLIPLSFGVNVIPRSDSLPYKIKNSEDFHDNGCLILRDKFMYSA